MGCAIEAQGNEGRAAWSLAIREVRSPRAHPYYNDHFLLRLGPPGRRNLSHRIYALKLTGADPRPTSDNTARARTMSRECLLEATQRGAGVAVRHGHRRIVDEIGVHESAAKKVSTATSSPVATDFDVALGELGSNRSSASICSSVSLILRLRTVSFNRSSRSWRVLRPCCGSTRPAPRPNWPEPSEHQLVGHALSRVGRMLERIGQDRLLDRGRDPVGWSACRRRWRGPGQVSSLPTGLAHSLTRP